MPDAPVPPLRVFPELWRQSREQYPLDQEWPDQLRLLCKLAHDFRRQHCAVVKTCGRGEQLFLKSLDLIDVEDFILSLRAEYPDEPNPMLRIDPNDPGVDRSQYPDIYPTMNGHKVDYDA
jgi:hypothetical protein